MCELQFFRFGACGCIDNGITQSLQLIADGVCFCKVFCFLCGGTLCNQVEHFCGSIIGCGSGGGDCCIHIQTAENAVEVAILIQEDLCGIGAEFVSGESGIDFPVEATNIRDSSFGVFTPRGK